ncbi:hypothetical protein B2J93_8129 [Marssonina coronariae]|uniref:Uncharacterized protein n=1 Tax=Diplocarpon coronariae TaxID=2795749 RepID=A0A218YRW0_9HELO|nr:hypothetical protein B2J93_8129 [Marssonina coronariae]
MASHASKFSFFPSSPTNPGFSASSPQVLAHNEARPGYAIESLQSIQTREVGEVEKSCRARSMLFLWEAETDEVHVEKVFIQRSTWGTVAIAYGYGYFQCILLRLLFSRPMISGSSSKPGGTPRMLAFSPAPKQDAGRRESLQWSGYLSARGGG